MFPFPLRILKAWGNFFWYLLLDSNGLHGGKSYKTVGTLLWMGFPGVFNSQTCIHWAPSCSPTTFQVFQFQHWFLWRFPLVSLCSGKWLFSVFTCQSLQSWGQWFALCPPLSVSFFSLLGLPKKICYIRVCSAFHLLKWSGDSKILTCRTRNWGPHYFLNTVKDTRYKNINLLSFLILNNNILRNCLDRVLSMDIKCTLS